MTNKASGKPNGDQAPGLITIEQAARLLLIGEERIRQHVKAGRIPRPQRGLVPLVGAVQGRLRYLEDELKKSTQTASLTRVQEARARSIELRNLREEGKLCDTEEAVDYVGEMIGAVKSDCYCLPARLTRDLAFRRKIEAELDGVFHRAADRAAAEARRLRGGRDEPDDMEAE